METLSYENLVTAEDAIQERADNNESEQIQEWLLPLFNYITAHADEVRQWPWMGGAEIRLGSAMWSHQEITIETVDSAWSEISAALAKQPAENEETEDEETDLEEKEPQETEEPDSKTKAKTDSQKPPESFSKIDKQIQPKAEIDKAKRPTPNTNQPVKPAAVEPKVITKAEPNQPHKLSPIPEAPVREVNETVESTGSNRPAAAKISAVPITTRATPEPQTTIIESYQEFTAPMSVAETPANETNSSVEPEAATNQLNPAPEIVVTDTPANFMVETPPAPTLGSPELYVAANPIVETQPAADIIQVVQDQAEQLIFAPEITETGDEPEPTEPSILSVEEMIFEAATEIADERIQVIDEPISPTFDYEIAIDGDIEGEDLHLLPAGEEIIIEHFEEITVEPDGFYHIATLEITEDGTAPTVEVNPEIVAELELPKLVEVASQDESIIISPSIEEIKDLLIQLADQIEAARPEMTERTTETLDKIIELTASPVADESERLVSAPEVQEELETLFTELFENTAIDYTPELIEALVLLTIKDWLSDESETLKDGEVTDDMPQEIGTHEAIKQLLVGLSTLKKALANAGSIGKSALRLYSFNLLSI